MEQKKKKICKNCSLYNPNTSTCDVTVIHEGEYLELTVRPYDRCWWERMEQELATLDGEETHLPIKFAKVQYDLENKKIHVETPIEPTLNN